MRTLTNVSDTGHGPLTVSGSGVEVIFTTTNTESSDTAISFTDGTGGDITSTSSTTGVTPVAQINTITIAGTVDEGDVFTVTLPTVGDVSYIVTASDTTTSDIATNLNTAIQNSTGYAGQSFTSSVSTNTITLTAKVAGTGFTQTSSATNRAAVAQVVVFTPTNAQSNYRYIVTINGTNYTYDAGSSDVLRNIVEGLQSAVTASSAVTCTENDSTITCTSASPGTAFTYSTSVSALGGGIPSSKIHYGCKDENALNYEYFAAHKQSLCKYPSSTQQTSPSIQTAPQNTSTTTQETLLDLINEYREVILQAQKEGIVIPPTILTLLEQSQTPMNNEEITSPDIPVRDLEVGMVGEDVRMLQKILNSQGYILTDTGEGSVGNETTYFGELTKNALQKYQEENNITPSSGYFGPITRSYMKSAHVPGIWW